MPELPEVETVRRGLAPVLVGATITRVEQRRPDLRFPLPERLAERLEGLCIDALDRRAKYLVGRLSGGEALVMHLGMTGRVTVVPPFPSPLVGEAGRGGAQKARGRESKIAVRSPSGVPPPLTPSRKGEGEGGQLAPFVHEAGGDAKHDHVVLHLASGASVTYNDARRFGFMLLIPQEELEGHPLFAGLGPEPLGNEFGALSLASRAAGRRTDLKAFLMDQRTVAGLGNIYVAEALHRARLSPDRLAATLATCSGRPHARAERLADAVREVLERAISAGGSTLRDYRAADGALGYFQHQFLVYGREGEPCATPGCRGRVRRSIHAGRSTFHCPVCQR